MIGQTVFNRIAVPLYLTNSVSIGYDSNYLKFSQTEMDDVSEKIELLGDSDTFDSHIIKPEFRLVYSPVLIDDYETNFIFKFSHNQYGQSRNKSYNNISMRFDYHIGPYNWLKIGYSRLPNYYLRTYEDHDTIDSERSSCSFKSETISLLYTFLIYENSWMHLKAYMSDLYFNPNFTEFDTEVYGGELKITSDIMDQTRLSAKLGKGTGVNSTFNSGMVSTQFDRSYEYDMIGISVEHTPISTFSRVGGSLIVNLRKYRSELSNDPLHAGRLHYDLRSSIYAKYDLTDRLETELRWNYREKLTESKYDWVEELKSYSKYEFWVKFNYDFYLDLFY